MAASTENTRDLVVNRRARFEYEITDHFEAGIMLLGSEVKSLRNGKGNLQEAYVRLEPNAAYLVGCHISPYTEANRENHEPLRERKLLLHQAEIAKLRKETTLRGMTVVPLRIFLKGQYVKVEIAVARGKKLHDKRHAIKERDVSRENARNPRD